MVIGTRQERLGSARSQRIFFKQHEVAIKYLTTEVAYDAWGALGHGYETKLFYELLRVLR